MRLVFPVFLFALVTGSPSITKKGLCFGDDSSSDAAKCNDIKTLGVSWYYNWGLGPSCLAGVPGVEYVPMIWNANSLPIPTLPPGSDWLLGFNEPNYANQANLTPAAAAALWPQLEATGRRLVGPALADCGAGLGGDCNYATLDWYRDFFGNCTNCRVDAVGLHLYYCSSQDMINKITALYELTLRPVWLTEFACNAPSSQAQPTTFAQELLPQLEASSIVQRYSWFLSYCAGCDAGGLLYSSLLADETGSGHLTLIGSYYSDLSSTNPSMVTSSSAIYIDCGDLSPSVDSHGFSWLSDQGFSISPVSTVDTSAQVQTGIASIDPYIFSNARSAANISYSIPVKTAGQYNVTLYFSENKYMASGARTFSISIQGTIVQSNFDVFASAKGANAGIAFSRLVTAASNSISIVLVGITNTATISGLSVVPASLVSVNPKIEPMFINVGGGAGVDAQGNRWLSGAQFTQGGNSQNVTAVIANTTSDLQFVYQTNQWGTYTLSIPVVCSGSYTVELLFCETYWGAKGSRSFDVRIQGVKALSAFDIYDQAEGKDVAVNTNISNIVVTPTLPFIVITTTAITDNPLIAGVILRPVGAPQSQTPSAPTPGSGSLSGSLRDVPAFVTVCGATLGVLALF